MNSRPNSAVLGLAGLLITTLTMGCGMLPKKWRTEHSNSTAQGQQQGQGLPLETSLLGADDLKVSAGYTLSTISKSGIINNLNKDPALYNKQPKPKTTSTPPTTDQNIDCFSTKDLTLQANKTSVKAFKSVDGTDCYKQEYSKEGVNLVSVKATYRFNFYLTCSSKDLSYLNGKKISELEAEGEIFDCTNGTYLSQSVTDIESTTIIDGITTLGKSHTIYHDGTKIFGPCKFSISGTSNTTGDDCVKFLKFENQQKNSANGADIDEYKTATIYQHSTTGVTDDTSSSTNVWHNTGKIDIIYNNWTGTVTYKGSNTAPIYLLKETPTSAPITGSLTATEAEY